MAEFLFASFTVTFDLLGAFDGDRKKVVEFVPAGVDIAAQRAQLDTDIADYIDKFNDTNAFSDGYVSTAFIEKYTISEKYDWDDAPPAFTGVEDVYREAQIQADLAGSGDLYSTWIPAPAPQIFVGGSVNTNRIDTGDSAYLAYAGLFETGGYARVSDGETFTAPINVRSANLRSVRSGKSY